MAIPHPLPEDLAELIARRFRALSEPLRIRMLDLLREGELSVNELAEQLGAGQQNVSKHLGVLVDAGDARPPQRGQPRLLPDRRRRRLRPLRAGLRRSAVPTLKPRCPGRQCPRLATKEC